MKSYPRKNPLQTDNTEENVKESVKKFCQLNGLDENSQNLIETLYNAYIGSEADDNRGYQEELNNSERKK